MVALADPAACLQHSEHFGRKYLSRVSVSRPSFDGMVVHTGITLLFFGVESVGRGSAHRRRTRSHASPGDSAREYPTRSLSPILDSGHGTAQSTFLSSL